MPQFPALALTAVRRPRINLRRLHLLLVCLSDAADNGVPRRPLQLLFVAGRKLITWGRLPVLPRASMGRFVWCSELHHD